MSKAEAFPIAFVPYRIEAPTPYLRWNAGELEQAWGITSHDQQGRETGYRTEWRPVPHHSEPLTCDDPTAPRFH